MTGVRRPVVAGLAPGAGTSTLAAALHAVDARLLAGGTAGAADVLVCPSDAASLHAAAALGRPPGGGPRPVLVIPGSDRAPAGLSERFTAVVALPHVRRWSGADARPEAAAVLAVAPGSLPPEVRAYADVLLRVVSALVGSGQLRCARPPVVSRPVTAVLWRGLRPVARPEPGRAERAAEPDDEALEADADQVLGRTG